MAEICFKLKEKISLMVPDKINITFDFVLKAMTLLFGFLSFLGFMIIYLYFNNIGLARESFSYIYSFQYLFSVSFFSILVSLLFFMVLSVTFILSSVIYSNKYIDWKCNKIKNRCNLSLLFSFFCFWIIFYFKQGQIFNGFYILVPLFPVLYLFSIRNKIKSREVINFSLLFIIGYCVAILSQVQILQVILIAAQKNNLTFNNVFMIFLCLFVLVLVFYFNIEKLGFKGILFSSLTLIFVFSLALIYIPNKIMDFVGLGGFKSTYIVKSNGVNIYKGLESKIAPKWGDKKSIKLVDVYVVANLPEKIIVSSDEKDHIMYSIPKSSILSEVFSIQPNDKRQEKETEEAQAINNSHG
ncbi:hypothetical protein [Photobacterium kishitanii]|uniref:hypothetical protein n=1 Tax=Photobacterium kishitanii TaxID=318456 RepID=UPI000D15F140|nr:hypothetical protein [Photobacterium kishitanii]PSV25679.1 hypothetical protein C0W28_00310 [Photobacterium kishitanii]